MPFISIAQEVQLHYEDAGSGPVVLLLHGMLGTGAVHFGPTIAFLSQTCRVVAPSLRGYGQSMPKPRDFPPNFYQRDAADVLVFMDMLDITPVHLVGYSDGGEVALIAAGMQPQRFASVTTIGAVGYFGPAMRPYVQRMYPVNWVTPEQQALHTLGNPVPVIMQWIRSMKMLIDGGGEQTLPFAERITAPVHMLLGEEDALNPADYARHCLQRIANGRLTMFPGGHPVHENHPDDFHRLLSAIIHNTDTLSR